jgi:polysaccharide biosynthesis protein PslA
MSQNTISRSEGVADRRRPCDGSVFQQTVKRGFDIFAAITALLLISPLLIMFFLLAVVTPERPILCRLKRYDLSDRAFDIWQFRISGSKRISNPSLIGQLLRNADVNGALLFLNVLRGDMSFVGPAPLTTPSSDTYRAKLTTDDLYRARPGIVGWAQRHLQQDSGDSLDRRIEADSYYLANRSLWLDLKIIFLAVFSKRTSS